jgi:hypothetical protein
MKSYREINVNKTLVVVFGCDHFFMTESLDSILDVLEVSKVDKYREFTRLKEVSGALAQSIPCCPNCKCPVRQFATQRYNRVINRAVNDERYLPPQYIHHVYWRHTTSLLHIQYRYQYRSITNLTPELAGPLYHFRIYLLHVRKLTLLTICCLVYTPFCSCPLLGL